MMVTQVNLLNFSELCMNISLNPKVVDATKMIGIRAIQSTFRYAMLSKISVALVSINKQSYDRNTPEDWPACRTDESESSI